MRNFEIRVPTVDDAERLVAYLHELGDNDDHPGILPMHKEPTEAEQREWILKYLNGGGHVLLLFDGDRVLGCAELTRGRGPYRAHCVTLGVSLVKEARGQGYGTALMEALHAWARSQPELERIQLEVFHTNPGAIHLYERMGYTHEGRRIGAIKHDGQSIDMLQMSLVL